MDNNLDQYKEVINSLDHVHHTVVNILIKTCLYLAMFITSLVFRIVVVAEKRLTSCLCSAQS